MSLEIAYYRGLKEAPPDIPVGSEDDAGYVRFGTSMEWSEGQWPGRGAPWDWNKIYSFDSDHGFRVGSASSYNEFRRWLSELAENNPDAFREQIEFADNEGVIGSVVSAKLANDYYTYNDKARVSASKRGEPWLMRLYDNFSIAFATAGNNGAVELR